MNKHRWLVTVFAVCLLLSLTATLAMAQGPNPPGTGAKPITSVNAGTGLTGGGTSGDVTLAITTTYRLPQACANGQVPEWNGTAWACANDSLMLPFAGSVNDNGNALAVVNTGTGRAALLEQANTSNVTTTLAVGNRGGGNAISATNIGTGRAGTFIINNPANNSRTLDVSTNGTGSAGNFSINNSANNNSALNVTTNGTGSAGSFFTNGTGSAGSFSINNPANSNFAFFAGTNGTGGAATFDIKNTSNNIQAVYIKSNGGGDGLHVQMNGTGVGGRFGIVNSANSNHALTAYTEGTGQAAQFVVNNPANNKTAFNVGTNGTGWAGSFWGQGPDSKGVYISVPSGQPGLQIDGGTFAVSSGVKSALVPTTNGARLLYTEESSQVWFTDYGFGRLQNGRATIAIDPLFAQTINLNEPYHVFVQAYGDAELYVTNRTSNGFQVRARDGDQAVEFSYRLVAKRLGFEDKRLEHASWADNDPNLYPGK